MNGAESLFRTASKAGVEICFANPGTTEMPLVAALDEVSGIRAVLGLFEGVLSGATDGYARMADKPALTLFHLSPGFGNAIANFHNARRARSPIVNLIGDQATWHRRFDAPLTSDIESLARPVSGWYRDNLSAGTLAGDVAEAIAQASRDILSSVGSGLAGGVLSASSVSIGDREQVYEAIHGHAPELEGTGLANPLPILTPALELLRHLDEESAAERIEDAVRTELRGEGARTPDLGGEASTREMVDGILNALQSPS